ncbi:MAG TPA: EthD family reductase [Longimicrobium sp.]|nr:EthD family reductase [Longimicrobium sp.]
MAKLVSLFNPPADADAFARHLTGTHIPLAKKIPGLRSLEASRGPVMTPEGPAPYHLVGVLSFDSMDDLQAGLGSPEGQAAAADIANFATGGVTVLVFDSERH